VARYALALTEALVAGHGDLVERVLISPDLPAPDGIETLSDSGVLTTTRDWPETGGCYHAMAPFDPDTRLADLWPAVVTARRMQLVVTVYDLIPDALPDVYLADPGRRRRYRARRELVRCADHVVTISQRTALDVEQHLGINQRKVTVIGTACGAEFVPPTSLAGAADAARAAVGGLGPAWVLYNGAVEPRKNTETLVRAYAELPAAVRDRWQLVIVCALRPLERNHFEVMARQLGIEGRLVLPGYVDDPTLVALNQGAALVAFPSRYEGYGLPVAEALACGAAVVASGNSAPAELVAPGATFDPDDLGAITSALYRGLTDPGWRTTLLEWAARPQPRWADVAARTAACYSALLGARPRPRRPSVALVTPMPPQRTGVADYSAQLVRALESKAEVEVFLDGDQNGAATGTRAGDPTGQAVSGRWMRPRLVPRAARYRGGYDAEVVTVGNSEFHAGGLGLVRMLDRDWVVLAHDVRLTGLYRHSTARGAVPEGFAAAFGAMYPGCSAILSDGWVPPEVAVSRGIFMARELIERAQVFATTSTYAASLARLDAVDGTASKVTVLPFAYPAVIPHHDRDEDAGLVCSFGVVNHTKQPLLLVDAIAACVDEPRPRLVFVGPTSDEERGRINAHATARGVDATVVGYVSPDDYNHWLRRAAVAVQLRRSTNGETSAAVADCLAHGVPTIVSDLGSARDLPDAVARLAPGAGAAQLAALISELLADPQRRHDVSAQEQAWVSGRGFDAAADDLLALIRGRPERASRC